MKKTYYKNISLAIQALYCVFCFIGIILCVIYRYNFDTMFGDKCADIALDMILFLMIFPAMPISIVLNILAFPSKQDGRKKKTRWLIWTILSPILYFMVWFIDIVVLVAITGGV